MIYVIFICTFSISPDKHCYRSNFYLEKVFFIGGFDEHYVKMLAIDKQTNRIMCLEAIECGHFLFPIEDG